MNAREPSKYMIDIIENIPPSETISGTVAKSRYCAAIRTRGKDNAACALGKGAAVMLEDLLIEPP
jgi:hypothetical protein